MARPTGETWLALALAGAGLFFVVHLWTHPVGTPLFGVSPGTLPMGMAGLITLLALILLVRAPHRRPETRGATAITWRLPMLVGLCILFVAALPWLGFLVAGAAFVGVAAWLYGARRPIVVLGLMVLTPLAIAQFFERAMVIYLPAGRLFE